MSSAESKQPGSREQDVNPHKMLPPWNLDSRLDISGYFYTQFHTRWESECAGELGHPELAPQGGQSQTQGSAQERINPSGTQGPDTGPRRGSRKSELMSSPAPKLLPHAAIHCSAPFSNPIIRVFPLSGAAVAPFFGTMTARLHSGTFLDVLTGSPLAFSREKGQNKVQTIKLNNFFFFKCTLGSAPEL